jgi:hypothetical protein
MLKKECKRCWMRKVRLMMRKLFFLAVMIFSVAVRADAGGDKFFSQLHAKRMLETIPSQIVNERLSTPVAVRYVRAGDGAPSCGLIAKNGEYIDLVSPEAGEALPACAAPLKPPIIFAHGASYLVYEYKVEDPKGQLTNAFQLYLLGVDRVISCKNDDLIANFAMNNFRGKGVLQSFKDAVSKFGCRQ